MNENLVATLPLLIQHLQKHIETDAELRMVVHKVAQALLEMTTVPSVLEENIPTPTSNSDIAAEIAEESSAFFNEANRTSSRQKNGARTPVLSGRPPSIRTEPKLITIPEQPTVVDDLLTLADRLRIKAEGARWAAERERLMVENVDYSAIIEPKDREIIFRARQLPDCFLWMCHRDGPTAKNRDDYETLAGCFDAAADIVLLIDRLEHEPDGLQYLPKALAIAAEAQSALRIVVNSLDPKFTSYTDPDQFKLFNWLRNTCRDQQILIHRYMRLDDPADPQNWQDIRNRIVDLGNQFDNLKKRDKEIQQLFKKIEYRVKRLKPDSKDDPVVHWKAIVEHTEQLIENGLQPSNPELREMLLPYIDSIPDFDVLESARNFQTVLREIDRYIASIPEETISEETEIESSPNVSEGVRQAAELLRGHTIILIGGDRRNAAAEALKRAFGLKELIWVEGRDQTYVEFEPQVAREDVSLVILAIRWSRHGFGEVKNFCERYNKPLVRLPGGYNPNQVAFHVLNQVGDRLAITA